ncbi:MAG TPA: CDP-alcohol phosphatidyltransferase family protein [Euzebyales bacterium]
MARSSPALARVADTLTATRAVIAIALVPAIASGHIDVAAVMLAGAWCTDMLDGRIARRAGTEGSLGAWDLHVDSAVGVAVLLGLAFAGHAPTLAIAIAVVLGGALALSGNAAAGLGLQTIAYAWFLVIAWQQGSTLARWLLPTVITALLVIDIDRFITVEVPRFISGIAALGDHTSRRKARDRRT